MVGWRDRSLGGQARSNPLWELIGAIVSEIPKGLRGIDIGRRSPLIEVLLEMLRSKPKTRSTCKAAQSIQEIASIASIELSY